MLVTALDEPTEPPRHAALSQRELQILCKLAVGRSVSEIAQELFISVKTVSTYRARVLEKMQLGTNADLTTYALRNGLVQ
jgi:DNA-binding NarL/FixJ family response regulator